MSTFDDALQLAFERLKEGELQLTTLCQAMALYGQTYPMGGGAEPMSWVLQRVLRGEIPAPLTLHHTPEDLPVEASPLSRFRAFAQEVQADPLIAPGLDRDARPPETDSPARYLLGKLIGKGGSGLVYHATDQLLRRSVALKMLTPEARQQPGHLRAFIEEAIIQGGLDHPHILPIHTFSFHPEWGPFYTMKRLQGVSLATILNLLRRDDPQIQARFGIEQLLTIFIKICDGIAYAHDRGVVHCDLNPNNILIGDYGEVRIIDWGISLVLGDPSSLANRMQSWRGTPGFMAPEQIIGDPNEYDTRTDIWNLGAILYSMLTLSRPYARVDHQDAIQATLSGQLMLPSERNPDRDISPELDRICLHALAAQKDGRYPDIESLRADVQWHLTGRRQRQVYIEMGQEAFTQVHSLLDEISVTEAIFDAHLQSAPHPDPERTLSLQQSLAVSYEEGSKIGVEALQLGAQYPPLNALLGDLYWRIFRRLILSGPPDPHSLRRVGMEALRLISATAMPAITRQARLLIEQGVPAPDEAFDTADEPSELWFSAILHTCDSLAGEDPERRASKTARCLKSLRQVAIFQDLPGLELLSLVQACDEKHYGTGAILFEDGDDGDTLIIVVEGQIELLKDGRPINAIGPEHCLGELSIIDPTPRTATARASSPLLVYEIKAERFREILVAHNPTAFSIMRKVVRRLREHAAREQALRLYLQEQR